MTRQPPSGVVIHAVKGSSNAVKVDELGFVVLSEWDVERIANAVAHKMREASPDEASADYVSVRRNKPSIPHSEY